MGADREAVVERLKGRRIVLRVGREGAADLRLIDSSLRFRSLIESLLPLGDANAILLDLAREGLPKDVPCIAGVCGSDPLRRMDRFLEEVRDLGFAGVANSPSVGRIDGGVRRGLEDAGMGFPREVDLLRHARTLGLLACGFAFTADEASRLAAAGVDLLVVPQPDLAPPGAVLVLGEGCGGPHGRLLR